MSESKADDSQSTGSGADGERPPPTWLEWTVRLVSLLLVVGLLGFLGWKAMADDRPVTLEFDVVERDVRTDAGRWVTPISVRNRGSTGISDLVLKIDSGADGAELRDGPITVRVAMLGPGEEKTITVWLEKNPADHPPRIEAQAFN